MQIFRCNFLIDSEENAVCFLHDPNEPNSAFIRLSTVKGTAEGKLNQILRIRDQRSQKALESPYRMKSICDQIPSSLDNIDLEEVGYHRNCYQNFTKNLDRLHCNKPNASSTNTEEMVMRSPRKRKSDDSFLFCGQKTHRGEHI